MEGTVSVSVQEHIATVIFERLPVNAIDAALKYKLVDAFTAINENPDVWCVIFTSKGERGFTAGTDMGDNKHATPEALAKYHEIDWAVMNAVRDCRVPVILAAYGFVIGIGNSFSASADVIVAAEGTVFKFPEVRIGQIGGTESVLRLMPLRQARYMAYTGEDVPAEELYRLGIVHKIVPKEKLMDECMVIAKKITANDPFCVQSYKEIFTRCSANPLLTATERRIIAREYHSKAIEMGIEEKLVDKFYSDQKAKKAARNQKNSEN